MNIVVNSQTLAKELRLLNKIVASKPAIPILSHVLLTATDTLRLSTTDLEIALTTTCPVIHIAAKGVVAIPVSKLLSVVEQIPNADVTILLDGTHVKVISGAFKSRLQAMDAADFPVLPEVEGISSTLALHALIERTKYAIAESSSKFLLQGALLTLAGPIAAMVATDSKRLALATASRTGADARVIIPLKTLDLLTAFDDIVELTVGERHLFFAASNKLLISRTLDGEFPKYERIIPRNNDKKAIIDRVALSAALRRVGLVSEQNQACYFAFDANTLDLASSSAEVGEADERIAVAYTGEPLKVCCNWRYVLDFLEAAAGQTVTCALKDALSPMLWTDGDDHLAVIMGMRL